MPIYGDDFNQRYQELFEKSLTEELGRAGSGGLDPERAVYKRRSEWEDAEFWRQVAFITNNFFAHLPGGMYDLEWPRHVPISKEIQEGDSVIMTEGERFRIDLEECCERRDVSQDETQEMSCFNCVEGDLDRISKNIVLIFMDMLEKGYSADDLSA